MTPLAVTPLNDIPLGSTYALSTRHELDIYSIYTDSKLVLRKTQLRVRDTTLTRATTSVNGSSILLSLGDKALNIFLLLQNLVLRS